MKYIYGPVSSWRLGKSLGIDLISRAKYCSFECGYCQVGKTQEHSIKRAVFVPTKEILAELDSLPKLEIDYITFSGCGEPTLALNIGEVLFEIKKRFNHKTAVLTNSTLLNDPVVRKEISLADLVCAKLDAADDEALKKINLPVKGVKIKSIIEGLKQFNKEYPNKLALQIMFTKENKNQAQKLAEIAKEINPKEVQLNTPLRKTPNNKAAPLTKEELEEVEKFFASLPIYNVYRAERPDVLAIEEEETQKRRPGACSQKN